MSVALSPVGIELPEEKFAKPQSSIALTADIATLMRRALDHPLEYPPLSESVFPGDKVVIVLHADLPRPHESVQAIMQYLIATGVKPSDVTVLTSTKLESDSLTGLHNARCVVHDPDDDQAVAYISANIDGDPVYVNRVLFDADVILPVNFVSQHEATEDCVYPRFSSAATIHRYHRHAGSKKSRVGEIRQANENLGVFAAVQVVTGPGGHVQDVFFGGKAIAENAAREKAKEIWSVIRQAASQLVIATIESNLHCQTWEHFCQALIAADQIAEDCDQIVVGCEIAENPGKQIRQILQIQFETDPQGIDRILSNASPMHRRVAELMSEKTVFLKSRLAESIVEELGLGYIGSNAELQRLVDRVDSGVLLRDAHLCRIV